MAEKTTQKQRGPGRPFKPGQSGNPKGKPQGSRHKATIAALNLLEGEAQALTRKCIDLAMEGDMGALRLCLERIVCPVKDRPNKYFPSSGEGCKRSTQDDRCIAGGGDCWENRRDGGGGIVEGGGCPSCSLGDCRLNGPDRKT